MPRRRFIRAALGAAAASSVPGRLVGAPPTPERRPTSRLSADAARSDDAFWALVRDQFPLRPGFTLMNSANLCPAPYPVVDAVFDLTRAVDEDASFQNRGRFSTLRDAAAEALARYVGALPDEIAITRNTTEGNNVIVGGLDLGPGDEVVLWDQNHPSNSGSWDIGARRFGYTVVRVRTPPEPRGADELLDPFARAIGPATRVLAFSHHSNATGVALPARELCGLARDRGVFSHVDGAQTFGWLQLDLHAMGCDSYAASAHKWFMGPKEAGLLYVRRDAAAAVWPLVVGLGWERALETRDAARFETLGQRDDATVAAMARAVAFHESIGPAKVETRVREIVRLLREGVTERVPGVRFHTPPEAALSGGVLVFEWPGIEPRTAFSALYDEHDVACAARTGTFPGVRLSPHVYNTTAEVEHVLEAVARVASG